MKQYLRKHAPKHVTISLLCSGRLHSLGDRTAQASSGTGMLRQDFSSHLREFRRRGRHFRTIGTHHLPAERLLLIGHLYHINLTVQAKIGTGHGKSRAPLPCSRLRGNALQPLLLGIEGLGYGRIELMAAAGVVSFKLVINFRRRLQLFFQTICPYQRGRTVHLIELPDLLRDIDVGIRIVQLLLYQLIAKYPPQLLKRHGLQRTGIQQGSGLILHIGPHIIPLLRHLILFQIDFVRDFLFY